MKIGYSMGGDEVDDGQITLRKSKLLFTTETKEDVAMIADVIGSPFLGEYFSKEKRDGDNITVAFNCFVEFGRSLLER